MEKISEIFGRIIRKEISTKEGSRLIVECMNSPEYRQWKAKYEAKELKDRKAGRVRRWAA